jgi:hypothetical protein
MSCVLRIAGRDVELAKNANALGITFDSTWSDNDRLRPKAALTLPETFGIRIVVSDADFEDFSKQVSDAITFLAVKGEQIKSLISLESGRSAILDFAVSIFEDRFHTFEFPIELAAGASHAGVSLALSPFPAVNA